MHQAFRVHMLNEKGKGLASEIAGAFDELAARLFLICPQGRELAIVMTKLEEACFFAKKAIANVEANQADAATTIVDRPFPSVTPIGADTRPELPAVPPADATAVVATKGLDVAPVLDGTKPPLPTTNAEDQPAPGDLFREARQKTRAASKVAAASAAPAEEEPAPPAEEEPAPPAPPPPPKKKVADGPNPVELFRQAKRAGRAAR